MFLFCVTRQSIADRIASNAGAPSVREFRFRNWVVTTATDQWLSTAAADAGTVLVAEAPPFARESARAAADGAPPELLFGEARFIEQSQAIEIYKSLIGGRQVYYHAGPGGGFFCSSHARLLRAAGVPLEDDPGCVGELFVYRYVTAPRTLFKGIDQLLAGQRLRFELDGDVWRPKASQAYSPPHPPDRAPPAGNGDATGNGNGTGNGRYGPYGDRTRDALRNAMTAVAPAGNRLRVLASGGLDSSILFKIAQAEMGVSQGYSTGYPFESDEEDVEKRYALTAAEAFGAEHHLFKPTVGDYQRGFLEAVALGEEPIVHTQSILMLLLFRDGLPAGEGTVVVGQGADGAFGLRIHRVIGRVRRFAASHPRLATAAGPVLSAVRPVMAIPPVSSAVRKALMLLRRDPGVMDVLGNRWGPGVPLRHPRHVLWRLGAVGPERWARRRFGATREQVIANRAAALDASGPRDVLDEISLLDYLSDVSVTQGLWSKFGEAAGKVVYYPFNARELLDCAFATPWEAKLAEPKWVLRDVARKLGVPEFIVSRSKANFNARSNRWAERGGVFDPFVPLAAKVFDEQELRAMQAPDAKRAFTFFTMLNYAIWKRLFVHQEPLHVLLEELERSVADAPRV
jgi:asparagine synthetase B (glutamine-hydrolysing)